MKVRIPMSASVERVSRPGDDEVVYVVTGVSYWEAGIDSRPKTVPSKTMRIRRDLNETRWCLEVDGVRHSTHRTLRSARTEASAVEFGRYA